MSYYTMNKIQSVTVGSGGAASISFTSIAANWDDLCFLTSCRSDRSANAADLLFTINSNSSSIYSYRQLYGFSGGAGSATSTETYGIVGQVPAVNSTANTFENSSLYFPNYLGSTNKSYSIDNVWESNSSTVWQVNLFAGLFANTSAISSVVFTLSNSSNFVEHSTATLYGIKKS